MLTLYRQKGNYFFNAFLMTADRFFFSTIALNRSKSDMLALVCCFANFWPHDVLANLLNTSACWKDVGMRMWGHTEWCVGNVQHYCMLILLQHGCMPILYNECMCIQHHHLRPPSPPSPKTYPTPARPWPTLSSWVHGGCPP